MALRAGLLRSEVTIQRRFAETDASGQAVEHWQDVDVVWARAEPLGGREGFGQEQWVATGDVRFTMRWRDDVTPLERLVHQGREYDVVSAVDPDGTGEQLLVVARARTETRVTS